MPHRSSQLIGCWRNVMLKKCVRKLCISSPFHPEPFKTNQIAAESMQKSIQIEAGKHSEGPNGTRIISKGIKIQPKGHPTEAGLHPRQPNGAKRVSKGNKMCQKTSKVSKVEPKAIHMEPKGPPRRPKWRPKWAKCWICMDSG